MGVHLETFSQLRSGKRHSPTVYQMRLLKKFALSYPTRNARLSCVELQLVLTPVVNTNGT